jgi:hypothetical protein
MVNGRLPTAAAPPAPMPPKIPACGPSLQRAALKSNAGEIQIIQILGKSAAYLS